MQGMQELPGTPNQAGDENSPHPGGAETPEREKPNFWLWLAVALIIFMAISAGIYFLIFK